MAACFPVVDGGTTGSVRAWQKPTLNPGGRLILDGAGDAIYRWHAAFGRPLELEGVGGVFGRTTAVPILSEYRRAYGQGTYSDREDAYDTLDPAIGPSQPTRRRRERNSDDRRQCAHSQH